MSIKDIITAAVAIKVPFYADDPPQAIIDYEGAFPPEHVALMDALYEGMRLVRDCGTCDVTEKLGTPCETPCYERELVEAITAYRKKRGL